jgi:hypothetical protein
MDFSTLIPWIATSLNSENVTNLLYWSQDELYQYAETSLGNLTNRFLLIAVFDDTTAIVANQPLYELPTSHIAIIAAAIDGTILKPSTARELEAFDTNWEDAASATPTRWVGNALGMGFIRLYAPPASGTALQLLYQQEGPILTAASPNVLIPPPIADYLAIKALEHARERQGDAQMTDAAGAFRTIAGIYEQACASYWGN